MVAIREPGGTPVGEGVRDLLLDGDEITPGLRLRSLRPHARSSWSVIRPALDAGRGSSATATRLVRRLPGHRAGLGEARARAQPRRHGRPAPRSTFVVLVDPKARAAAAASTADRIERENAEFVDAPTGYRSSLRRIPSAIVALDGGRPADELRGRRSAEHVRSLLRAREASGMLDAALVKVRRTRTSSTAARCRQAERRVGVRARAARHRLAEFIPTSTSSSRSGR